MSDQEIRDAIAAGRRELADVLAGLTPEQWDTPSLCAGWRVREVIAHLTMAFRLSAPAFVLGMLAARGNFNRMADHVARRDAAAMTPAELTAAVADNVHHPWKPPGGGLVGALTHDTVHGLDVTVPLGLDRPIPENRIRPVLDNLCQPRALSHFGAALDGVQLRADDLDWTYGAGSVVSGSARDLALVVSGRTLPPGRVAGAEAARFTA